MDQSTKDRFSSGFRGKPQDKKDETTDVAIVIAPEGDADSTGAENTADAGTQGAGAGDTGPGTGTEGGDEDMPEMTHNEKTWQGRLAKREAELRAREAALAGGSAAADQAMPGEPAPTGEEVSPTTPEPEAVAGEGMETPAEEALEDTIEDAGEGEESGDIDLGTSSEILADAPDEIKAIGERWIADFGPEFISDLAKMTGYFAEAKAGAIASEAMGPLKQQADDLKGTLDSVIDNFMSMHRGDIEDNEPDFETVVNSPEFEQWVTSQEPDAQARIVRVLEGGSATRIVKVLKDFKDWTASQAEPQAGQVDTTALEAAGAVRSAGTPVPAIEGSSGTASPDDAFRRGFYRNRNKA